MAKLIIALDGVDGSGKSTAARLLHDYLHIDRKLNVTSAAMPGATPLGAELRRIVKSKKFSVDKLAERFIFAADGAQFVAEVLPVADIVICDRYPHITDMFYGSASGVELTAIDAIQALIPTPMLDLLFIFQIEHETARFRKQPPPGTAREECRIETKGGDFLKNVAELYNRPSPEIATRLEHRCCQIVYIDANLSREAILSEIKREVDSLLKKHNNND